MKKYLKFVVLGVLLLASFTGAFLFSSGQAPPPVTEEPQDQSQEKENPDEKAAFAVLGKMSLQEKEVSDFAAQLKEKLRQVRTREHLLEKREKRIQIAQAQFAKEIKETEDLRIQLNTPLNRLKKTLAKLESTGIVIRQAEKANIKKIADVYSKMQPAKCCEILETMFSNEQGDDVARILRFMPERSAGKVLGEMKDKTIAAKLYEKMKGIREEG